MLSISKFLKFPDQENIRKKRINLFNKKIQIFNHVLFEITEKKTNEIYNNKKISLKNSSFPRYQV